MKIVCDHCPEGEGAVSTLEDWLSHLVSELHLRQLRNTDGTESEEDLSENIGCKDNKGCLHSKWDDNQSDDRSIVITHIPQMASSCVIIKYFSKYGFVADFYMEPSMKFCIVEYDCRDCVFRICIGFDVNSAAVDYVTGLTHVVNGKKLYIQPKASLTECFWTYLPEMEASDSQSFLLNHLNIDAKVSSVELKDQLHKFMELSKTEVGDVQLRASVLEELLEVLKTRYPYCILYPIGSFRTGLFDKDYPFEIQVDPFGVLKTHRYTPSPPETFFVIFSKILNSLQTYMKQEKRFALEVTSDGAMDSDSSIRFIHNETGIECVLYFNAFKDVHLSYLIVFLLQFDTLVYPFLHSVLYWARFHNLHLEMNKSIILLCIAYLNQKEVLPTLSFLQSLVPPSPVQSWNISYCSNVEYVKALMKRKEDVNDIQTTRKVLNIILEFFELCSTTDFAKYVVCTNTGELLLREIFVSGQEYKLPPTLNAYKRWKHSMGPAHFLNIETPLCIQSPFHLGLNESPRISAALMERFQKEASETVKNIRGILSDENPNFMRIFSERKIGPRFQRKGSEMPSHSSQPSKLTVVQNVPNVTSVISYAKPDEFASTMVALKKVMRIKTSKTFIDKFNDLFGQEKNQLEIVQKRKVLLTSFLWDFMALAFGKCFYMQADVEEILEDDPRFSDFEHELRGKFLHRYSPRSIMPDHNENSIIKEKDEDVLNYLAEDCLPCGMSKVSITDSKTVKIRSLPPKIRNNFCRVITVWGLQDIWSSRHKIKKDETNVTEKQENCDPMVEEENVTKLILRSQKIDKNNLLRFSCTALVDTRDENPILYMAIKDANSIPCSQFPQAANYISVVFGPMAKAYTMFRLDKWLNNDE